MTTRTKLLLIEIIVVIVTLPILVPAYLLSFIFPVPLKPHD